jgi:tetratricopeptide (TPR) repeat protein
VKQVDPPSAPAEMGRSATDLLLEDVEDRFSRDENETYWESVERIQTPQGLDEAGNISLDWDPDTETLTINKLVIRRGTTVIDVLANGQKFLVLRRENNLERAMLDGTLTAAILPEGLQVGDVLELAATWTHHDPVLEGLAQRTIHLPERPAREFRIRETWTKDRPMRWHPAREFPQAQLSTTEDGTELLIDMHNTVVPKVPKDAPDRFDDAGEFEISAFATWEDLSTLMAPLYQKATVLKPDSPIKAEAAKIRLASTDPKVQAGAALRLVQDKVRYVFLGMNAGGYKPTDADVTWVRRFGDCKGKTVLLLSLLHELGIEAVPALVDSEHGDGMDGRLPGAGAFDHVIVRATIDGKQYWLDGTDTGNGKLDDIEVPPFKWALPIQAPGAGLEAMVVPPMDRPEDLSELRLDASHGLDLPASAHATLTLRGELAVRRKLKLTNMSEAESDQYLRDLWRNEYDWITVDKVSAIYDEATGEERLTMDGSANMGWKLASGLRRFESDGSGLGWKPDFDRDPGPYRDAPFAVPHPYFTKTIETIVLPNDGKGFTLSGDDFDRTAAGREFKRSTKIENGVFTMEAGVRSIAPEFPASEAEAAKKAVQALHTDLVYLQAPKRYRVTDDEIAALMAKTPTSVDEYISRGDKLYDRNDYERAIADFDKAIELDPGRAGAYADRGNAYLYSGKAELAAADFAKALALNPRQTAAIRGNGIVRERNGDYRQAIDSYSRALDIDQNDEFALEHRALAYAELKDGDKALADYDQLLKLAPDRARTIHLARADLLMRLGRGDDLLAEADRMAALDQDEVAYRIRGVALLLLKRNDDARKAFDQSIAIRPTPAAYLGRSNTFPAGDHDQRLPDVDMALKLDPEMPAAHLMRAGLLLRKKDVASAMKDLDYILAKSPDNVAALQARAAAYIDERDFVQAEKDIDVILGQTPNDYNQLNSRCWVRAILGKQLDDALADCENALKLKPDFAAALDSRAFVQLRLGQLDASIDDYDAALKQAPQQSSSLFGRGIAKLRKGATEAGKADLAAARAIDPGIDDEFAGYGVTP